MIRLGMLQFRIQAITAAVTLAAFAILLAATGPHLASMYAADGLDSCHGSSCLSMATYFTGSLTAGPYGVLFLLSTGIILLAPAVIGLFWGAPLIARELETGTADLAWNQSVTRTRWLAVKLAIGGLTAMAVTEALCLMQTWWAVPISQAVADGAGSRGRPEPVQPAELRHPRHHPARLRRVRLRPRRRRRGADPAHRPGHGRHPGHLRRPPGRDAAVGPPQPRPARPHGHPGHLAGGRHPVRDRRGRHDLHASTPSPSPASPAPGSCPAGPSTPPGSQSAPPRPPAYR